MTAAPETDTATARAKLPAIIYLPDDRQRTKKVTSGSNRRKRQHLEQFRTDDTEHERCMNSYALAALALALT